MSERLSGLSELSKQFATGAVLIALLLAAIYSLRAEQAPTPKAIFLIVDGIPADVIESTHTPFIDEIASTGGYTNAFVGGEVDGPTESPTVSAVGYNSLLTGTWANKHNVYNNSIENPDYQYWDIFRIVKNHDTSLQTALFSTWLDNRTRLLGDGLPDAGGIKLDYYFDGFELDEERFPHDDESNHIKLIDQLVSDEAERYIQEIGPDLSWVYLQYTDDVGHRYGDGEEMTAAVTLMDGNIGKIWQAVKHRQESMEEDWLIVITTDHGRDVETGRSHGGQSERERKIWIATNSQFLQPNFYGTPAIVDVLPSIAKHLQLSIPEVIEAQLDGEAFIDKQ
ncbi:MAG: alkaline phosphatase family protein [Gammaproteobacteria bacterium]|nr:alkaline phosphatase family protein [Gammaproteobacteria bacterium]MDD9897032.1 alkaline phosphatase family protein [Gammaproteobacteria bacterium]MDD9959752.1 alkaline phosphatase family protein [Gammaproteobacteria bacterium]